ncbi:unnamed protein product [Linum trigynum]|uniref:Uncharacterized protein n=1 Tax=Linum trigynum TaxID=586398 RepID=A0AAV2D9U6_9ROSI
MKNRHQRDMGTIVAGWDQGDVMEPDTGSSLGLCRLCKIGKAQALEPTDQRVHPNNLIHPHGVQGLIGEVYVAPNPGKPV